MVSGFSRLLEFREKYRQENWMCLCGFPSCLCITIINTDNNFQINALFSNVFVTRAIHLRLAWFLILFLKRMYYNRANWLYHLKLTTQKIFNNNNSANLCIVVVRDVFELMILKSNQKQDIGYLLDYSLSYWILVTTASGFEIVGIIQDKNLIQILYFVYSK